MRCIYCNTENDLTLSDIIPYALTGAKVAKAFVCKKHNSFTNDNYEKPFINNLNYFRNQLGFLTRDDELIKFKGNVLIDGELIHGVMLSDKKSLYAPKKVVAGYNDDGEKVLFAPIDTFKNMKGNVRELIDAENVMINVELKLEYFIGHDALHSVAKIGYEWYCYINNIESKSDKFEGIINYILGDDNNNFVDIVVDGNYYQMIDMVSQAGTNSLFQYDDIDGYTYVIFNLWNGIAYRIRICEANKKDKKSNSLMFNLYLYHLDGQKTETVFGAHCFQNEFSIKVVDFETMSKEQIQFFIDRTFKLTTTKIISIYSLKRDVESFTKSFNKFKTGKIELIELIGFESRKTITVLEILSMLYENQDKYDETTSFNQNLKNFFRISGDTITRNEEEKKEYILYLKSLYDDGKLESEISEWLECFNRIWELEIERIRSKGSN